MKKKKGFTLIELVIVVAIITILAAIAIPKYENSKKKAAIAAHNANVEMLTTAGTMASSDGVKDKTWKSQSEASESEANKYIQKWPEVPKGINLDDKSYEVTIDANGHVSVSPGQIKENPADKK
ncbi:MAG: prepilin-type N-terminal cleavage/methylation domain-containing protein [Anaerococcus sp.]|uniref:prepilin-type N-terminal cleavage/methylation domain-containing protein n=1 Tax=Anaerococcus sp. TaxID=1872515 RepID=UPI00260E6D60|nr:prepilin-type N-terminal cleavage/methylation domain-containing protein [Anaerococcus sp.]MCI5972892.1 prepilin-type N-terminal cleavage/methylation domain-containing protein [Anaerococcus sp.]MDD6919281.1 prepilin-type N-terminal cleavage/methylation domain-containing protein [Peptoniphilaceae bacterium]MDY2927933.1 prepilin-type N-terminal cleavage/methylation domain-containing protein [Anaerococcus sp.]